MFIFLPLAALLLILGIGLWRERMASLAEESRRLAWLAETGAEQASQRVRKVRGEWAWSEVRIGRDGEISGRAWFPEVPLPQPAGTASRLYAAGRFRDVTDRYPGAFSPGGLPLGPMAAYRQLVAAPDSGAARDAVRELQRLAIAQPSAISTRLLEAGDEELHRRGLAGSPVGEGLERWHPIERIADRLHRMLDRPLPPDSVGVKVADGSAWWVEVSTGAQSRNVLTFPLDDWTDAVRSSLRELPVEAGTRLTLIGDNLEQLPGLPPLPAGSGDWPNESAAIAGGAMRVLALRDPSALLQATRLRIGLLGVIGLVACGVIAVGWWRMRRALVLQRDLVRQKDDFLSTVSHELRTPVSSLRLLSENLLSGKVPDGERTARYHERILQEARGLSSTVENLLDFASMQRGDQTCRFEPINLRSLANDVMTVLRPLAEGRRIDLRMKTEPVSPPPRGDTEGIGRVILILADNAIKFSPTGSTVNIVIGPGPGNHPWSIRVEDQGPGIPLEDQERIFDRFFRGGNVLDRKTRGTGIGLSIARHVIESHGGRIELTSSSTDGSVFTCVLPRDPTETFKTDENSAD